jgi:hypothetical protein
MNDDDRYDVPGYDPALLRATDEVKQKYFPGPSYGVGSVVKHVDGRKVRIAEGTYWSGDGPLRGLSNHWTWYPVDEAGNQVGERESGYGDQLVDPKLN